jgi:general secretion pathway protein K
VFVCMNCRSYNRSVRRLPKHATGLKSSRGAVLILALLIVALVAGFGIKFAGDYQLGLARAESRWHGAQARAYGYSAEGFAITNMSKDGNPDYDSFEDGWSDPFPMDVEGGGVLITITDANGQFNLNSVVMPLVQGKASGDPEHYSPNQRMFIRLLQTFPELVPEPSRAIEILESIVDWTDADNTPADNGAEDSYYLSLVDPYQPANVPFRSIEELRMVRGITPELMQVLRPYLIVLPGTGQMNLNTMQGKNADSRLYRCINLKNVLTPLDEPLAARLIPPLGQPYKQKTEFDTVADSVLGDVNGDKDLATKTDLFWLTTQVQIGEQRRTARSLLMRGMPLFTIVRREEVH